MKNEKETTYGIRLPENLLKTFEATARGNDRTGAQLVRDFMREYIKKNAQGDLLKASK